MDTIHVEVFDQVKIFYEANWRTLRDVDLFSVISLKIVLSVKVISPFHVKWWKEKHVSTGIHWWDATPVPMRTKEIFSSSWAWWYVISTDLLRTVDGDSLHCSAFFSQWEPAINQPWPVRLLHLLWIPTVTALLLLLLLPLPRLERVIPAIPLNIHLRLIPKPPPPPYSQEDVRTIEEMFPTTDRRMIIDLLNRHAGNKDAVVNHLLQNMA